MLGGSRCSKPNDNGRGVENGCKEDNHGTRKTVQAGGEWCGGRGGGSSVLPRSENDYSCILKDILDLQQAKELSEDIRRHQSKPHGKVAGYIWQR